MTSASISIKRISKQKFAAWDESRTYVPSDQVSNDPKFSGRVRYIRAELYAFVAVDQVGFALRPYVSGSCATRKRFQ